MHIHSKIDQFEEAKKQQSDDPSKVALNGDGNEVKMIVEGMGNFGSINLGSPRKEGLWKICDLEASMANDPCYINFGQQLQRYLIQNHEALGIAQPAQGFSVDPLEMVSVDYRVFMSTHLITLSDP